MPLTDDQKAVRAAKRNIKAALEEEARAHRREAKRAEWRDQDMYPTREDATTGAACRGCGLPLTDGLGDWPPLMQRTPEEAAEYEAAEALFRELHPNCGEGRWGTQGSRVTHCMLCCPPLPIPDSVLEELGRVMASFPPRRDEELDVWALDLTCGHRVEKTAHYTNRQWTTPTIECTECGATRGIVTSERTTDAAARAEEAKRKHDASIAKARRELAKAEAAADEARAELARLEREQ